MNFTELKTKLDPKLKAIAKRLNGRFTFFNEEDLYQEELLHLWIHLQKGELNNKTDSYILQGCYFHLKNYLRKVLDKVNLISLDSLVNNEEEANLKEILPSNDTIQSSDYLESKLLAEEVINSGLTKREREVFSLCLDGLNTREIGKRLGISHVRVVKLRNKIKDKCKELKSAL